MTECAQRHPWMNNLRCLVNHIRRYPMCSDWSWNLYGFSLLRFAYSMSYQWLYSVKFVRHLFLSVKCFTQNKSALSICQLSGLYYRYPKYCHSEPYLQFEWLIYTKITNCLLKSTTYTLYSYLKSYKTHRFLSDGLISGALSLKVRFTDWVTASESHYAACPILCLSLLFIQHECWGGYRVQEIWTKFPLNVMTARRPLDLLRALFAPVALRLIESNTGFSFLVFHVLNLPNILCTGMLRDWLVSVVWFSYTEKLRWNIDAYLDNWKTLTVIHSEFVIG